jgi:hypothetical protein
MAWREVGSFEKGATRRTHARRVAEFRHPVKQPGSGSSDHTNEMPGF